MGDASFKEADEAFVAGGTMFKAGDECVIRGTKLFCVIQEIDVKGLATARKTSGEIVRIPLKDLLPGDSIKSLSQMRGRPIAPKPPLKFLTYEDMIALPDPRWLVEGLIMEKTSALMFGKSNSFKSFLAIDIACHVAMGRGPGLEGETRDNEKVDWHGQKLGAGWACLYVATEGALGVAKQRIPGWYEHHGVPPQHRSGVVLYPQEIALDDDKAVDALLRSAAIYSAVLNDDDSFNDPYAAFNLVVIDIFGASMMGPETSDETARAWVRNINRIMRKMGCAVLTVAHTGWADDTRARMHTHFWGSFDTRLKAEGDKKNMTTVLSVDRHKDADSSGEWGFKMELVTFDGQDGLPKTTLVPVLSADVDTTKKPRLTGPQTIAMQALSECIIEKGRTIAGPNYPNQSVVSLDDWRVYCDRHGLTDSADIQTKGRTFRRIRDDLHHKGEIRSFDGMVWKVSQ